MVYHRILNIIPCTVLYSCLGNPEAPSRLQSMGSQKSWTQQQLSNNYIVGRCCLSNLYTPVCICSPTLQVQLSPTPLPLGSYQSVLYVPDSASEMLQAHLCCILDSAYKWYHMEFVFLVLIYLVCSSLVASMLLQKALFHSFYGWAIFHCILWCSSVRCSVCNTQPDTYWVSPRVKRVLCPLLLLILLPSAAQQPREAGRSNSPTAWLEHRGGLRAWLPPGARQGTRLGARVGAVRTPRRADRPRSPCPSHSRFRIPRGPPIQQLEPQPRLLHPTAVCSVAQSCPTLCYPIHGL